MSHGRWKASLLVYKQGTKSARSAYSEVVDESLQRKQPTGGDTRIRRHASAGADYKVLALELHRGIWRVLGTGSPRAYWDRLTPGQRIFLVLDDVFGPVSDGFYEYYYWESQEWGDDVVHAARAVRADAYAELFMRAQTMFPAGVDPSTYLDSEQGEAVAGRLAMLDEEFRSLEARGPGIFRRILDYIEANEDDFYVGFRAEPLGR